ncbi:MAG: prepilin-type N-terminal cleavage/methylation domain-containing protein [Candidatus Omnitrophica bacterium]|nr:prepilin-type N-terminal cleavage/methylation domain-containing protein [Candidatus Omnitrophota bacterium]
MSFYFKKAFTLIELLMVLVLVALIAGLALPNLLKGRTYIELKQTAKDMARVMQYAQQRSVIDNREYQMQIDSSENRYWLMAEVLSDDVIMIEKEFEKIPGRMGKVLTIPEKIEVQAEKETIHFYPNGLVEKVQINLTDQKNKIVVSTKEQRGSVYVYEAEE